MCTKIIIYLLLHQYSIYKPRPSNGVKFQPQSLSLVVFRVSNFRPKIQIFINTVDGSEILLTSWGWKFSHDLRGFSTIPFGCFGMSEPSTVSIYIASSKSELVPLKCCYGGPGSQCRGCILESMALLPRGHSHVWMENHLIFKRKYIFI